MRNILQNLRNLLETWKTCNYHGLRIKVPFEPRCGKCEACHQKAKTNRHHWIYAFTYKEVRENVNLVIKYTTELCFTCHRKANAIRQVYEADPTIEMTSNDTIVSKLLNLRKIQMDEAKKDGRINQKKQKTYKYTEKR